ncbi:MAG: Holliday junction branch migration protein RuvA [Candidatus Eisenbacteria bacterium]
MIESVRGKLRAFSAEGLIVEVAGLGLLLQTPAGDRERLTALAEGTPAPPSVQLFTHLVIRPESWQLFGFLGEEQRDLFRVLLEISGVGPRMALNVVSRLSLAQIQQAVAAKAPEPFEAVPGVGRRTAERMLLELSGKLRKRLGEATGIAARSPVVQDAIDALVALGITQPEAIELVQHAARDPGAARDSSTLIAAALQRQRAPRGRS